VFVRREGCHSKEELFIAPQSGIAGSSAGAGAPKWAQTVLT
jgi:hypothetical protein